MKTLFDIFGDYVFHRDCIHEMLGNYNFNNNNIFIFALCSKVLSTIFRSIFIMLIIVTISHGHSLNIFMSVDYFYFLGIPFSTLSEWRKIRIAQNEPLATKVHGNANRRSNAAKNEEIYRIFNTFVIRIRSPSGRRKGNHLYRLPSYIKRFAPNVSKSSNKYERKLLNSLFHEFNLLLKILFQHGNNIVINF